MKSPYFLIPFVLVLPLLAPACESFQPSQICGVETEPNHELYSQHFEGIQLSEGNHEGDSQNAVQAGRVFEEPTNLVIDVQSRADFRLRLCLFKVTRGEEILFDETFTVSSGEALFELGQFERGTYLIRVYADGALVENIPFQVR